MPFHGDTWHVAWSVRLLVSYKYSHETRAGFLIPRLLLADVDLFLYDSVYFPEKSEWNFNWNSGNYFFKILSLIILLLYCVFKILIINIYLFIQYLNKMLNMQNIFFIVIFSDIKMKNVYLTKTHFFQYICKSGTWNLNVSEFFLRMMKSKSHTIKNLIFKSCIKKFFKYSLYLQFRVTIPGRSWNFQEIFSQDLSVCRYPATRIYINLIRFLLHFIYYMLYIIII